MGKFKKKQQDGKTSSPAQPSQQSAQSPALQLQQSVGNQATMGLIMASAPPSLPQQQLPQGPTGPGGGFFQTSAQGYDYQIPQAPFLQSVNRDLQASYGSAPSARDTEQFPHLNLNPDGKRQAEIHEPSDRAALVKEAQDQKRAHGYVKLSTPSLFEPDQMQALGRIQNPPARQLRNEQHFYDASNSFTPYPREAEHLQKMADDGRSEREVWQALDAVGRGQRPPSSFRDEELALQSVPTITNISEVQRSPLMGAASNLEIANQAQRPDTPISFQTAFGQSDDRQVQKKSKKKPGNAETKDVTFNLPGTISSTGSGAVHQFQAVEQSMMEGNMSDESVRKKVKRAPQGSNVEEARDLAIHKRDALLDTFEQRIQMTDIDQAQSFSSEKDRRDATMMRLYSGVDRNTKPQMGLMGHHNLRPLVRQDGPASAPLRPDEIDDAIEEEADGYFDPPVEDEQMAERDENKESKQEEGT